MTDNKHDIKPDVNCDNNPPEDRGENIALMQPLYISDSSKHREKLNDLSLELAARSSGFRHSLPDGIASALSELVRSMNCYYSNLIEGHNTHPVDIERALNDDYSEDHEKRDLQLEAKAHIQVQRWIDEGGLDGRETTSEGLCEIHQYFCEQLPEKLLWVENPETGEIQRIIPGQLRRTDVQVGQHVAISPGAIPRFLTAFDREYSNKGKTASIIAAAGAHHRFLWVHPFIDGNGRVARLMSHAILKKHLGTGGLWSVTRGLARSQQKYKGHLQACDLRRRNDLDGRGNLSEECLADFTTFFLETCIDQIDFMENLVAPKKLQERIRLWAEEEIRLGNIPKKSILILDALLYRGELPRADIPDMLGTSPRQASRTFAPLMEMGVIQSKSTRASLTLSFPATLAPRWMPGLFPDH
ncbi:Fic family protein [Terasakiella sp. A23]|uniref:Fic family protein n=1 Tax=Terasakiella sp. FCG-A23 TaxID=3080561 RepID=UPI002954C6D9|nr:Fic family protein [Terasakiella sp. A23]MDV7341617.1 Fic family protein [Terasakiella sp. A23]